MPTKIAFYWKSLGILTMVAGVAYLAWWSSSSTAQEGKRREAAAASGCRNSATLPSTTQPQIDCPAPPNTFDGSSFFGDGATSASKLQAGPTFDAWAWASFAAFNWPAKADGSQPISYLRGIPDLTKSFAGATSTDVLVWETFKEKREVFNANVEAGQWQDLSFSPEQALDIQTTPFGQGKVPACTPQEREAALKLGRMQHHRRVLQAAKLAPSLDGDNTLDETAEVASPPQEPQSQLCAGYSGTNLSTCRTNFQAYDDNPDAPYPPTERNPRLPVGPRVYEATSGNILYYEVKLNYDYYDFVTDPPTLPDGTRPPGPYNDDANAFTVARAKNMNLPYRTSSNTTPSFKSPQPPLSVLGYDADKAVSAYGTLPATPPPVGSVQIKTAWQLLTTENLAEFHVSDAVYFSTDPSAPPENVCYRVGTFGLVGIHIIQRVHLGSAFNTAQATGGTYVFATWEHTSVGSGKGYSYISFLADSGNEQTNPTPYPTLDNAIQVAREKPYPLDSTQQVTNAVWSQLPAGSIWRNYRLIGTQFLAIGSESESLNYNQPYYLANLLIETNTGLQNFQGLPPGVFPIAAYEAKGIKPTGGDPPLYFEPKFANIVFNGNTIVMGGCMGCHGVAQVNGYNFSFVLQDGQQGAGIDTVIHVAIPPQAPSPNPPPPPGG